jgi:nicotinate phosphoribosyltransferase
MTPGALSTDFYELAMVAGYRQAGLDGRATFELYARRLPPHRSFLVAAGLAQALEFLEGLRFSADDVAYLRGLPQLSHLDAAFFDDYLPAFRFSGEVWGVPEGTPVCPPAPLLRVTAPLPEAQLVETALLALVAFQTTVASKAARIVGAAGGRSVVEFGARRAHGVEAGVLAARAAYLAGGDATSNVEAGRRFGIPVSGTMAHSWVLAFPDEDEAFRRYGEAFGEHAVFLLDTFDTIAAARRVAASGLRPAAVRLDSGDLDGLSRHVRGILDAAGLGSTKILASGDLDEDRIATLVEGGAPVDGFGVGAALTTSFDAPSLGAVYKLVEIEREGVPIAVMKSSPDKETLPGRKQVWRIAASGIAVRDIVEIDGHDGPPGAVPLLEPVMRGGRRIGQAPSLASSRERCAQAIAALPRGVRRLQDAAEYPVQTGDALGHLVDRLRRAREE